jgi:hypothetical protein
MIRLILAFALAPLAVPVLLVSFIPMSPSPAAFVFALELSVVISYLGILVLGLPIYLYLRAYRWWSFWIAPIVGFVAGGVMWVAFSVMFVLSLGEGMFGVQLALTDKNMLKGCIWPGGVAGACVGILFWLIARPDSQSPQRAI